MRETLFKHIRKYGTFYYNGIKWQREQGTSCAIFSTIQDKPTVRWPFKLNTIVYVEDKNEQDKIDN